jgi:hypothetical protein
MQATTVPSGSSPVDDAPPLPVPVLVPPTAPDCIAFKASVTIAMLVDTLPLPLPAPHAKLCKASMSLSVRVSVCVRALLTEEVFYKIAMRLKVNRSESESIRTYCKVMMR